MLSTFAVLLALLPAATPPAHAADAAAPGARAPAPAAAAGELQILPDRDLLASLGLRLSGATAKSALLRVPLQAVLPLEVAFADGGPTAVGAGALRVPALRLANRAGALSPELTLQSSGGGTLDLELVDDEGAVWMRVAGAMRWPDASAGLRLVTADLRAGPALAAWTRTDSEDLLLGNASLQVRAVAALPAGRGFAKSCSLPNWPGTPGYVTDVLLTDIPRIDALRCRVLGETNPTCASAVSFGCDGPGGSEGEVVLVPSARLHNSDRADAADVPWFEKFVEPDPLLYPGGGAQQGVDQHPYLVWNLYRIDADGALEQIARSGLKHAFATANESCAAGSGCVANGNILGRACSDLYNAGSNDLYNPSSIARANALVARAEVIPSSGQWGRCGSAFDDADLVADDGLAGCDGIYDAPPATDCRYRHRMVARESDIDPGQNPGARWFVDAWYVVRGDENIFNSMGFREIHPTWLAGLTPPRWTAGTPGTFTSGSVLDLWHASAPIGAQSLRTVLDTDDGTVLLVSRVEPHAEGGYAYRYALMSLDFSRAVTAGAEPNLAVLQNTGIAAVGVADGGFSTASAPKASDPARGGGAQWQTGTGCGGPSWSAAQGTAGLGWGELMHLSMRSPHPPSEGDLIVIPTDPRPPATLSLAALVPDAGVIFCDPFE